MTVEATPQGEAPKVSDKELNFRQLESKYERQLAQERSERERIARELDEIKKAKAMPIEEDDDDAEPYVDKKKLKKEQAKFGQQIKQETKADIQRAVQDAIQEERRNNWINNNPDFAKVMSEHAQDFYEKAPDLAETILQMPEGFERQKLVYHSIKRLGIDQPQQKQPSIQDKIDANRRSPFYQPTGISTPAGAPQGDFSEAGKKSAYEQMQKLKANLRLG